MEVVFFGMTGAPGGVTWPQGCVFGGWDAGAKCPEGMQISSEGAAQWPEGVTLLSGDVALGLKGITLPSEGIVPSLEDVTQLTEDIKKCPEGVSRPFSYATQASVGAEKHPVDV